MFGYWDKIKTSCLIYIFTITISKNYTFKLYILRSLTSNVVWEDC